MQATISEVAAEGEGSLLYLGGSFSHAMLKRPKAGDFRVQTELACVADTVREIESAGPFPEVPLRVVTGGLTPRSWLMSPGAVGSKRANQQELVRLSPLGEQVIAQKSGHFPQLTEPELVLRVLRELVEQARATV